MEKQVSNVPLLLERHAALCNFDFVGIRARWEHKALKKVETA